MRKTFDCMHTLVNIFTNLLILAYLFQVRHSLDFFFFKSEIIQ